MAYDAFLKLDGVTGESQKDGHKGEIDLQSFSWGASNAINNSGTGLSAGRVSVSDFSIMKPTDSSSAPLFQKCCDGTTFATAVVTLQKSAGSGGPIKYLVYNFQNVFVSSIQWSGSGGGGDEVPMESVSFAFQVGTIDYTPQADTGSGGGAIHGGWDVGSNVKA